MNASRVGLGGIASVAISTGLALATADLQARPFEDKFGRVIEAELVSHTGSDADTVKINKAGKTFEVKLDLFSAKDREFIREWMATTPPQIDYAFRVKIERKAVDDLGAGAGEARGSGTVEAPGTDEAPGAGDQEPKRPGGFGGLGGRGGGFGRGGRADSEMAAFDVKITSLTRHTIAGLKVECRSYMIDHTSPFGRDLAFGGFGSRAKREAKLEFVSDIMQIEDPLRYNGEINFTTKAVRLDERRGSGDDYKDELLGVIVRIVDKEGQVVFEHRDRRTEEIVWEKEEAESASSERELFDWQ